jgi:integrase
MKRRQSATALRAAAEAIERDEAAARAAIDEPALKFFANLPTALEVERRATSARQEQARTAAQPPPPTAARAPAQPPPPPLPPPPLPGQRRGGQDIVTVGPALPFVPRGMPLAYAPEHFRCSRPQVPGLAAIFTGHLLADAAMLPPVPREEEEQTLAERALTHAVRMQHHGLLAGWKEWLRHHPALLSQPLSHLAEPFLWERAAARDWQWQTLHRNMCSLVGACSNAPLYTNLEHPIPLSTSSVFRQAMSAVSQRAQQSQPRNQAAVSQEQVEVAVEEAPSLWQRVALILMWLTSARVGCVLQLRMQDLAPRVDAATGAEILSVHFAHGKGVKMRGPYTVFATLAAGPWREALLAHLERRWAEGARPTDLLLPGTPLTPPARRTSALLAAVRAADPGLNLRAMRRGSLQTIMQQEGCTVEELMQRAGHTNAKTTRRYLAFGLEDREAQMAAIPRTRPLQPTRPPLLLQ